MAEFTFTTEQQQLRTAVRKFNAENFTEPTVRQLMESKVAYDPAVWRRLGTELGVLGMSVPEVDGGVGGSLVDQAVAVEEFGATLSCGPLFGTVYLAVPALVACPTGAARGDLLAALIDGDRTAAFAVPDTAGVFAEDATVTVAAGGTGDAVVLTGKTARVVDATMADVFLVAARGSDGVGLYAVDAADVALTPLVTMDLTRPQADIEFSDSPARLLAGPAEADRVINHALQVGAGCSQSSRLVPPNTCSTCRCSTPSPACSSAVRSAPSRRSSTSSPTCSLISNMPARPPTTASGRCPRAPTTRRWPRVSRRQSVRPRSAGSPPTPFRCTAVSASPGNTKRICILSVPPPMPHYSAAPNSTARGWPI